MDACSVEVFDFKEKMVGKPEVGFETDLAPWIALYDRLPNLEGLFVFTNFESRITGLQKLAGCAVFYDGSTFDDLWRLSKEGKSEEEREESFNEASHVN
jgi:hypothetical protein|tara:strand:+ start:108 stop:404 length:297 start_codon:yes stop_codon:yes gene_type:complete